MNGFDAVSPIDETALSLPADAAPAAHTFEGHLELQGEDANGEMTVLRGDPDGRRKYHISLNSTLSSCRVTTVTLSPCSAV